jgi:hypothetical protein
MRIIHMTHREDVDHSRGQVLLIVAFAMMALIAVGAIVVDLGMSWMLRRQEQNAADPASIAASRYIEQGDSTATRTKMDEAACFYAQRNGFFAGDNATCDAARGDGRLQVHWPPISGDFAGRTEMVQVIISADHQSFFGQFFGQPHATVTTSAVAARESTNANTNSLVALDPDSCDAGKTHGNGTVTIEPVVNPDTGDPYNGGYVHVNSSCGSGTYDNTCGSGSGAFHQGGNAGTNIIAPMIYIKGTCQQSGGTVESPVTEGADRAPDPMAGLFGPRQEDYPPGHCPKKVGSTMTYVDSTPSSDACQWNKNGTTVVLTPGVYWGGWNFSGNDVTIRLEPGIYIIAGGGVSIKGSAEVDSTPATIGGGPDPDADPARVLIYSTDNTVDPSCATSIAQSLAGQTVSEPRCVQGPIAMAGQSSLRIWGLDSGPWKGMLLWQDRRSSNPSAPIDLSGQGVLDLAGTIYAPSANVKITGNGDAAATKLAVQVISWTWDIGGNGNLYMPYDPADLYHITQQGLVD